VARAMYTTSSPEQARRDAEVPFMWFKQTGQEVSAPPDRRAELLPENFREYRRRFTSNASSNYEDMAENVTLFGAPDQVAEKIERLRQSGVENLILFVNYGGIENQKVLDSLELFAAEVMPQFKDS
jgi:alkanesulfonate monooxygenase SsuD/methylene tetrahydromethanopterin reductase-like flavin-dependent oxidoreductase (luciferase family)